MSESPHVDLWQWILGIFTVIGAPFATVTYRWVNRVNDKLNDHETRLAIRETTDKFILASLDRIEEKLETKPKE